MSYGITSEFKERVSTVSDNNPKLATRLRMLSEHFGNGDIKRGKSGKFSRWRFLECESGGWYSETLLQNFEVTQNYVLKTLSCGDVNDAVIKAMKPHLDAAEKARMAVLREMMPNVVSALTKEQSQ